MFATSNSTYHPNLICFQALMVRGHGVREAWRRPLRPFLFLLRSLGPGAGILSRQPRPDVRSVRLRIRHSGNQDHPQRFHHQRLPGQVDLPDQVGVDHAGRRCRTLPRQRGADGSHGLLYRKHLGKSPEKGSKAVVNKTYLTPCFHHSRFFWLCRRF